MGFKTRILTLATLMFCMLSTGWVLSAQNTKAQEAKRAKIEKEIAIIDKQLADNANKSGKALDNLKLIRKKISDRKSLLEESDTRINELTSQINAKQREIDKQQADLDTLTFYYGRLLKNAYKNRDSKLWYMYILASDNIGQAFRRLTYLRNLSSEMDKQADRILDLKAELEAEKLRLSDLKSDEQAVRAQRAKDVQKLQSEEKQANNTIAQLKKNRAKYQKELAAKKRQVEALNREIQRIISSAVKGGGKTSTKTKDKTVIDTKLDAEFARNKGKLPWPVNGPVVDKFGQHYHPIFTSVKLPFNNGVTIAVTKGASVKAVFNGVVKQIVVIPGYNKCVLVQHGNYFSFYCKLASVDVKAGDKVKTGDYIGVVDTIDGMDQLHFQIWKGTSPQNPELWLQ